jgi:hypothetical protein
MLTQITTFKGNALAIELTDVFTKADAQLMMQLFDEKLSEGNEHVNLLLQVKDMSILKHTDFKALMDGEVWGFKHFEKVGRCAVVAQSEFIKDAVKIESKALHLANAAFEEKYFETGQLEEALRFISPEE